MNTGINKTLQLILNHALERASDEFEAYSIVIKNRIKDNKAVVTVMATVQEDGESKVLLEIEGKGDTSEHATKEALTGMIYKLIGGGIITLYESNYQD